MNILGPTEADIEKAIAEERLLARRIPTWKLEIWIAQDDREWRRQVWLDEIEARRMRCLICGKEMPDRGPAEACVCGECYRADPEKALAALNECQPAAEPGGGEERC